MLNKYKVSFDGERSRVVLATSPKEAAEFWADLEYEGHKASIVQVLPVIVEDLSQPSNASIRFEIKSEKSVKLVATKLD